MKTTLNELAAGDSCAINQRNGYAGNTSSVGVGKVTRVTPKQIVVLNRHGNLSRYWIATGKAVGTADPFCFYFIAVS